MVVNTVKVICSSKSLFKCSVMTSKFSPDCICRKRWTMSGVANFNLDEEIKNMSKVYPTVKEGILSNIPFYLKKQEFEKFLDYNFQAIQRKGMFKIIMAFYRTVSPALYKRVLTAEQQYSLAIVNEMWNLVSLINDDIIDESEMRFGFPAWWTFNDKYEILTKYLPGLYSSLSLFIQKNPEKFPYYKKLLLVHHKYAFEVIISASFELFCPILRIDMDLMEFYRQLVVLKTTYFFALNIKSFLYSIGYEEIPYEKDYDKILVNIGFYLQAANDYLDHFGSTQEIGKNTDGDIKLGTISWPLAYVWKYGSEDQRKFLVENYGKLSGDKLHLIFDLYEDFKLREKYITFEENIVSTIKNDIQNIPDSCMQSLALTVLNIAKNYRIGTDIPSSTH